MLTHKLILGSKSPRRQELIKGMGFEFEIRTLDTDESYPKSLLGKDVAGYLATIKADALIPSLNENELLLTSDTVVIVEGEVLGKPTNEDEAIRFRNFIDILYARGTIFSCSGVESIHFFSEEMLKNIKFKRF
jgi:septum formation protein